MPTSIRSIAVTRDRARAWLPRRPRDAHKGSCGRIFAIAGGRGMTGAAVLLAKGAVESGAGLVKIAAPAGAQAVLARRGPLEIVSEALSENRAGGLSVAGARAAMKSMETFRPDVAAAGPGLGAAPAVRRLVLDLLRQRNVPLVLDADALNVLRAADLESNRRAPAILTPHPGEFARLFGSKPGRDRDARARAARAAARRFGAVVLLKGAETVVTDGAAVFRNTTGNAGMASAGMGDVLTGLIASLWGQAAERTRESALRAAALAAYLHGAAGDRIARKGIGLSILASRLAEELPAAIRELRR